MVVGCYAVDLYCDYANADFCHKYKTFPVAYTGNTEADCLRQARKDGWQFRRNDSRKGGATTAKCPKCVQENVKLLDFDSA